MGRFMILLALTLPGCSTTSGVLQSAPNQFIVSASVSPGGGGASSAKKSAYEQANVECARQGRVINVVEDKTTAPSWTDGMYTTALTFKCNQK